jgi:hypothetical protein
MLLIYASVADEMTGARSARRRSFATEQKRIQLYREIICHGRWLISRRSAITHRRTLWLKPQMCDAQYFLHTRVYQWKHSR